MRNPYWNKKLIKDPAYFFGRKKETQRIFDAIEAPNPQNIYVIGERRIGKSSLLFHVFQSRKEKQDLAHSDSEILVFVDFHENPKLKESGFWKKLDLELKDNLPKGIQIRRVRDRDTFTDLVKSLDNLGYKVIIFIDEFGTILRNKNFEEEFFRFLRSLVDRYNLALIISAKESMEDLYLPSSKESPFFNVFVPINLGLFSEDEALDLITIPSKKEGIPLEMDQEFILSKAGSFPFFIQLLCYELFEYKMNHDEKMNQEGYQSVLERFSETADPHFNYFWETFSEKEREVLVKIARDLKVRKEEEFLVKYLIRKGYVLALGKKNRIFCDTFRDYILRKQEELITNKETTIEEAMIRGTNSAETLNFLIVILVLIMGTLSAISYFMLSNPYNIIISLIDVIAISVVLFLFIWHKTRKTGQKNSGFLGNILITFIVGVSCSLAVDILPLPIVIMLVIAGVVAAFIFTRGLKIEM